MGSQQKMTKQGVRDLDFGVSKKPQVVTVAEKPSIDPELAPRPPVAVPAAVAVIPPIEK